MTVTQDYERGLIGGNGSKTLSPEREGKTTKMVEKRTAMIPSQFWLGCAGASIVGSLGLKLAGRHDTANFVGMWAPTFLVIGLYNKMVKLLGSDRSEHSLS